MKKLFMSYCFKEPTHIKFIIQLRYVLKKQEIECYFHKDAKLPEGIFDWNDEIVLNIKDSNGLLFFYGASVGDTQEREFDYAKEIDKHIILVKMPFSSDLKEKYKERFIKLIDLTKPEFEALDEKAIYECAHGIITAFDQNWIFEDEIPHGFPFDYEKEMINEYIKPSIALKYIRQGCPDHWVQIVRKEPRGDNTINNIGKFRDVDSNGNLKAKETQVMVAAVSDFDFKQLQKQKMTFPLAGPRKKLYFVREHIERVFKIGIIVSGGIAPGTNAVIAAIFQRHKRYADAGDYSIKVLGFMNGFTSIINHEEPVLLDEEKLLENVNAGGSILGTSRVEELVESNFEKRNKTIKDIIDRLGFYDIEIFYIIGGDGTMRAAHVLWKKIEELKKNIIIAAIPKTMDNDVLWIWETFGFTSAVEKANELIRLLYTEARSNPRLCILQLFGSDSGYVITHTALASGVCDLFLIPEVPFTMRGISKFILEKLCGRLKSNDTSCNAYGIVLMAETSIPLDAMWYFSDEFEVGLTEKEKNIIRSFLKLDNYWQRPSLKINSNSIQRIKQYLGIDIHVPYNRVPDLSKNDKKILMDYAKTLRTQGQTPDDLRTAGLKLVSRVLQKMINKQQADVRHYWKKFRVFTNEPRHQIRAVPPTSSDILFGQRLGTLAVDGAMAGYTDFMISQWLTEYVMVPLRMVVLGRKRVPENGIFYKSAIAATGQPAELI